MGGILNGFLFFNKLLCWYLSCAEEVNEHIPRISLTFAIIYLFFLLNFYFYIIELP